MHKNLTLANNFVEVNFFASQKEGIGASKAAPAAKLLAAKRRYTDKSLRSVPKDT